MTTETLIIPKKEVLRFIVESAIGIQGHEESSDTSLANLALRMCYEWNQQIAFNLVENFADLKVALINDVKARANLNNFGHTIGMGIYMGELFAYDASIAQQGGIHEKRPVRIWQGDPLRLQTDLVKTFGGSWKLIDKATDFLTGKLTLPGIQVPYFHTHNSIEW